MKILLLADEPVPALWEHLDRRRLEGVDLVLSCGDLPAAYLSFLTCFTHAPILYVHGNHDGKYEKDPPEGCVCIEDRIYVHDGVRILGLGGSMRYNRGPHQYTDRQMRMRTCRLIPSLLFHRGFDILLTHAPALGVGDDTDRAHTGFSTFLRLMDRYHPAAMVHGHVHASYRYDFKRVRDYHGTQVINAFGSYVLEMEGPERDKHAAAHN